MLLVTNGEITEKAYLEHVRDLIQMIRDEQANQIYSVKCRFIPGDPTNIANKLVPSIEHCHQVWVVVDKDDNSQQKIDEFFSACERMESKLSRRKGNSDRFVRAIISNPCFEVWLAAHYGQVKPYAHQSDAKRHYEQLSGVGKDAKVLPDNFPFGAMAVAAGRTQLRGSSPLASNEVGNPPASAMPELLRFYGII